MFYSLEIIKWLYSRSYVSYKSDLALSENKLLKQFSLIQT